MGDIAELMLDGTLCEGCGITLGGHAPGHPRYCHDCKRHRKPNNPVGTKVTCHRCGRRVKKAGLDNHMKDAHGQKGNSNE